MKVVLWCLLVVTPIVVGPILYRMMESGPPLEADAFACYEKNARDIHGCAGDIDQRAKALNAYAKVIGSTISNR